ncbi:MAG: aldehyde ferredoxin oxidoreductase, partial [Desulfobacterales bacterium]|nr:aldehyde ferredoxin oxidoreductase [Desulfobacterales bacterium]
AMLDSTGLCLFTTYLFGIEDYQEFINAATGFHLSLEEVQEIGERIWNLERIFNIEAGISPDEDTLPERLLKEPLPDGPQKGAVAHLHKMLPDYYHLRGWSEKGIPDEMKLKSLGIL